jgi:hypothetical protein
MIVKSELDVVHRRIDGLLATPIQMTAPSACWPRRLALPGINDALFELLEIPREGFEWTFNSITRVKDMQCDGINRGNVTAPNNLNCFPSTKFK